LTQRLKKGFEASAAFHGSMEQRGMRCQGSRFHH